MYRGFYWDWTYGLVIIGFLICLFASARFSSTVKRYSQVHAYSGFTGAQAASRILQYAGIRNVQIRPIRGKWNDHYDPGNRTVNLSETVYQSTSLAALCVAAHECGHAIQHEKHYGFLSIRSLIYPIAAWGSRLAWPLFFLGLIMSMPPLLHLGVLLFTGAVLFQLVTLPVETNASHRALIVLEETGMLTETEIQGGKRVLRAAAMTYLAALAQSLLQLFRLLLLAGGRRRDD